MTFKSLLNLANLGKTPVAYPPFIDRYHSGSGGYHHPHHHSSYGHQKKGGGSGAALSALTLLAFLFLINIMQQSLDDNNSTAAPATTAVFLRDSDLPVVLDNREEKENTKRTDKVHESSYGTKPSKEFVKLNNLNKNDN